MSTTISLPQQDAEKLVQTHYENFPVAPFFLPKKLRQPIALIYAFARRADDLADEGHMSCQERLAGLESMRAQLPDGLAHPRTPFFESLNAMIEAHKLPVRCFHDLLDAFSQDVTKSTYATFDEVLAYCQKSANPVGRLILHLTREASEKNLKDSDSICTALQLINFLQDWYPDWVERKRIYIPRSDLKELGLSFDQLSASTCESLHALLAMQWQRCFDSLNQGYDLGNRLRGRLGFEIRLTIQGGWHMLKRLKHRKNAFERPTLKATDWVSMVLFAAMKTKRLR